MNRLRNLLRRLTGRKPSLTSNPRGPMVSISLVFPDTGAIADAAFTFPNDVQGSKDAIKTFAEFTGQELETIVDLLEAQKPYYTCVHNPTIDPERIP